MLVTFNSCPHCGAPINPGRSGGICAACALGDALSDTTERFEGHELQEEIARGGMGVVYRARQLDPPRDVALKTLLSVGLRSPSALERFRLETRAMASLQHPGILPVYVSGEQDGVPFFTMQLATGGTLAERSAEYAGAWRKLAELVAQLADAVQYAHERGVLHRDLKPGQRFNSLQTIADLTAVWPRRDLATLRTEAAAALALPDLRSSARWPVPHVFVTGTEAFSDDLTHYAFMQGDAFTIFDTASRRVVQAWRHPRASDARDLFFGSGLAWLGVQFADTSLELWPLDTNRAPFSARTTVAFHPDGESFFTVRDQQGLALAPAGTRGRLDANGRVDDPVGDVMYRLRATPVRARSTRDRD